MFTAKELNTIDTGYFSIIASGGCTVTLQSKNTGHCWHILLQEYPHEATLSGCLSQIRNHDACWLSRKSRRKLHKEVRP